jgi:hypothetical protein
VVDLALGGKLAETLKGMRDEGQTFDTMARTFTAVHGINVTGETLRTWCAEYGIPTDRKGTAA